MTNRRAAFAIGIAFAWLSAGCAAAIVPMTEAGAAPARAACRVPIAVDGAVAVEAVAWTVPSAQRDRDRLDAWCDTTGPPVIVARPAPAPAASGPSNGPDEPDPIDDLIVVTWNVHGGAADLARFVHQLRSGALTGRPATRFVLLLQEAYRAGVIVPRTWAPGVRAPGAVGLDAHGHDRIDVVRAARSLGLALYYVPSMRNGAPARTDEDRGNAILSTEPLSEFAAIELPFERQRRVAVAATVSGRGPAGDAWSLRVASVHLESSASARRAWILATGPRSRQARGLLDALRPLDSLVIGGDFNTWFGFSDPTYRTIAAAVPDAAAGDRRRTFPPFFRLDHLFSLPPDGWTVTAGRLDDRYGSDHYPILARLGAR